MKFVIDVKKIVNNRLQYGQVVCLIQNIVKNMNHLIEALKGKGKKNNQ